MSTSHFPQFRTDTDKIFKLPVTFVFTLSFFKFADLKFVRQFLRLLLLLSLLLSLLLLFLYQKFSFKTIFQWNPNTNSVTKRCGTSQCIRASLGQKIQQLFFNNTAKKTYKYNKNIICNYNVACNCKNEST